jgi:hypothetical protein
MARSFLFQENRFKAKRLVIVWKSDQHKPGLRVEIS